MKIFLDDDPIRDSWVDDTWTIVRTAQEALDILGTKINVDEISLDHDLGGDNSENSGYFVAVQLERWAAYDCWENVPSTITIHSANPVGRRNIQAAIDSIERMRTNGTF